MKTIIKNIGIYCCYIMMFNSYSQIICQETKEQITLANGNTIYVYQEKNTNESPIYYYVPTQINLSKNKGKPEYSFLEYKNSGSTVADGAIFHLLISWGLTSKELSELRQSIKRRYGKNAALSGALYLDNKNSRISINTSTKIGQTLKNSLKSKGAPPTRSSGKMALSFKLKKQEVKIIKEAIKSSSKFNKTILKINYSFNASTCKGGLSIAKKNNLSIEGKLQNWF